ncbi:MAG: hypothetical protein JO366_12425 [Methylobacteriaceae bacterium]|nr:hypothetical protein [Methylobacteriaceae bacterium]MBV9245606.1 hypothetical protein [Methylobacteriaceae bacterium]MBV9634457.1 hypothetical protein [Methylobacteriaceae bacterium]MBV9701261.1 hypothetical protein [Methylobacteriaceae bacterium]
MSTDFDVRTDGADRLDRKAGRFARRARNTVRYLRDSGLVALVCALLSAFISGGVVLLDRHRSK